MLKKSTLEEDIHRIMASLDEEDGQEHTAPLEEPEPLETYHVYPVQGGLVIFKEEAEQPHDYQVIEATEPHKRQEIPAYVLCFLWLFLLLSCIAFQLYLVFNPPTVTVIIIPKAEHITATGTVHLGRLIAPITLSQSQTVPTTGKGHQNAKQAQGRIIFFNGQLNSVTIPIGTVLTGTDGVQIVTGQDAVIPPADPTANPPVFGQATISAHASSEGSAGNIPAYDISEPCCTASVIAKNTTAFTGGQDERNFQTVAKSDIDTISTTLKTTLTQSMQGALQGQLRQGEMFSPLPCAPTVTSDHRRGEEATEVKVSVSETCSAVAYNNETLITQATDILSHTAREHLGTGYSLFGQVSITITQATVTRTMPTLIYSCNGTWVYALSHEAQEHIKHLIAGKTKYDAIRILVSSPGIEQASIAWGDDTKLPKDVHNFHVQIIVQNS